MTRHRIFLGAALLVLFGLILPLTASDRARADSPICCSDVKFPEYHGWGEGRAFAMVDSTAEPGRGVYNSIGKAVAAVRPGGEVIVKPGVYSEDKAIEIRQSVKISNSGGGIVRVSFSGECVNINLRRPGGKVSITGLSFETVSSSGACITVERGELALLASDITAVDARRGDSEIAGAWCNPRTGGPHPRASCLAGVLVKSGVATIQGNRIRRTGTAIALIGSGAEAHKVGGNYIAGNAVGIYVAGGAKFVIERNGIFRNHSYGVALDEGTGLVADNDIEDNFTGLLIHPPSAFSGTAYAGDGGAAADYSDMSRPMIRVERNLVTQYGIYRPTPGSPFYENAYDLKGQDAGDREKAGGDKWQPRMGYALDFDLGDGYLEDNVIDYPKRGSILSGVSIAQNCFFGPKTSLFDRDRFMPLIAPTKGDDKDTPVVLAVPGTHDGYKTNSFGRHNKLGVRDNDAATPMWLNDSNTWVEHLDYDGVDKIDHDNSIRSPMYDGFSGGLFKAIHNWFARNKQEMVCAFRFTEPVVSAPGDWVFPLPRNTNPVR
jgi:hypothetical protein